jgi:Signal peptidase, peptidase S26
MAEDKDIDFPEERKLAEEGGYLKEYEAFQDLKTNKSKSTKLRIATFCGACLGSTWYLLVHLTPVTGSSMSPTALDGGRVLAIAFMPWEIPQKGQIVQIRIPEVILKKYPNYKRLPLTLLKRVVAVPGDKVQNIVLAKNQYWVQGDNTNGSGDSRVFGPIPGSDFLSHVVYIFPPLPALWPSKKS